MSSTTDLCRVCGGTEMCELDGFYYCSVCMTQSQTTREVVVDDEDRDHSDGSHSQVLRLTDTGEGRQDDKKRRKRKSDANNWTSWEAFNYILKGYVDIIISLGASEKLKPCALQLWIRYLKKLKVAFCAEGDKKKPRLGIKYRDRDARVAYNRDPKTKKSMSKRQQKAKADFSDAEDCLSDTQVKRKRRKAVRAALHGLSTSHLSDTSDSETSSVYDSGAEQPLRLTRTKKAAQVNRLLGKAKRKFSQKDRSKLRDAGIENRELDYRSMEYCTVLKLLALINLALLRIQDKVMLCDIIRWCRENHIPRQAYTLLPSTFHLGDKDHSSFSISLPKIETVRTATLNMAQFLSIDFIPWQPLEPQIKRFVTDLNIPDDFTRFAVNIMKKYSVQEIKTHVLITKRMGADSLAFEAFALAYIMFVLKLFLGLDGKVERCQSELACTLNSLSSTPMARQFIWKDWVAFSKSKKLLLEHECFPFFFKSGHVFGSAVQNYIPSIEATSRASKYEPDTFSSIKKCISGSGKSKNVWYNPYEPSWYPTNDYVKQYLHRKDFSTESPSAPFHPDINLPWLSADFSETCINFSTDCSEVAEVLQKAGNRVNIVAGRKLKVEEPDVINIFDPACHIWLCSKVKKYSDLAKKLPHSYLYILEQMAAMVEMPVLDFYRIVCKVEAAIKTNC